MITCKAKSGFAFRKYFTGNCPGRKLAISYMATSEGKVYDESASAMMDCESSAAHVRENAFARILQPVHTC